MTAPYVGVSYHEVDDDDDEDGDEKPESGLNESIGSDSEDIGSPAVSRESSTSAASPSLVARYTSMVSAAPASIYSAVSPQIRRRARYTATITGDPKKAPAPVPTPGHALLEQHLQYQSVDYGAEYPTIDVAQDTEPVESLMLGHSNRDWNSEFQRILECPTTVAEEITVRVVLARALSSHAIPTIEPTNQSSKSINRTRSITRVGTSRCAPFVDVRLGRGSQATCQGRSLACLLEHALATLVPTLRTAALACR